MEDCNPQQLQEAIKRYKVKYGDGQMDLFKLEEIIREIKKEKKSK